MMMIIPRLARPATLRLAAAGPRRAYSTDVVAPLAYDHHAPSKPRFDATHSPILFLHGLFGSKKNNRAISKLRHSLSFSASCQNPPPALGVANVFEVERWHGTWAFGSDSITANTGVVLLRLKSHIELDLRIQRLPRSLESTALCFTYV